MKKKYFTSQKYKKLEISTTEKILAFVERAIKILTMPCETGKSYAL